jgi:hypothetical protein
MKNSARALGALLVAAALAGCETTGGSGGQTGVSVTRTHLGQPVARGEISVEPADPAQASTPGFAQLAAPVQRELTRLGWRVTSANAASEQVAEIRIGQSAPIGETGPSELSVRILRRSDATVAWEGRAQMQARAGASFAERAATVDRLARALFRDFPGESGRTITVR